MYCSVDICRGFCAGSTVAGRYTYMYTGLQTVRIFWSLGIIAVLNLITFAAVDFNVANVVPGRGDCSALRANPPLPHGPQLASSREKNTFFVGLLEIFEMGTRKFSTRLTEIQS